MEEIIIVELKIIDIKQPFPYIVVTYYIRLTASYFFYASDQ